MYRSAEHGIGKSIVMSVLTGILYGVLGMEYGVHGEEAVILYYVIIIIVIIVIIVIVKSRFITDTGILGRE